MQLLHDKTEGQHFVVVFDIGSASVAGAYVLIDKGKTPQIIFTVREFIPFQEKLDFPRFLTSMVKTLELVFAKMQQAGAGTNIDKAFCIMSSPWYASQTRIIKYQRPEPFQVTAKGIKSLIDKEIDLFRHSKLFEHSKVDDTLPEIIEAKTIQVRLNGYETRSPYGQRASEAEIALYISMIPPNILGLVYDSIDRFWHTDKVNFSSFSLVAYDTIRDIFSDDDTFLFIDVSGEITDISIIKDSVLLESISFPIGRNLLIRSIAKSLKIPIETANTELSMYLEGNSHDEREAQIAKILNDLGGEWVTFFEDALAQFSNDLPIPNLIFYTADENVARWFEVHMQKAQFTKFAVENGSFSIKFLGEKFMHKFVNIPEPEHRDPFLTIETVFANKVITILQS